MLVLKLGVRLRVNDSKNGLQEKDNFLSFLHRNTSKMQFNDLRKGMSHSVGLEQCFPKSGPRTIYGPRHFPNWSVRKRGTILFL